jgi:hypothetical protein
MPTAAEPLATKHCPCCKAEKPTEAFGLCRKYGRQSVCRECKTVLARKYRASDPGRVRKNAMASYWRHRDSKIAKNKLWKAANAERVRAYNSAYLKAYCAENADRLREWRRAYNKARMAADPNYAIKKRLRLRLSHALNGKKKRFPSLALTGCTVDELRQWIEDQFDFEMHWGNVGAWHLDHYLPCAAFDLTDEEQAKVCFHWSNMRPIWREQNAAKGDALPHDWERRLEITKHLIAHGSRPPVYPDN